MRDKYLVYNTPETPSLLSKDHTLQYCYQLSGIGPRPWVLYIARKRRLLPRSVCLMRLGLECPLVLEDLPSFDLTIVGQPWSVINRCNGSGDAHPPPEGEERLPLGKQEGGGSEKGNAKTPKQLAQVPEAKRSSGGNCDCAGARGCVRTRA